MDVPILFVNGDRRGVRIRGRAAIGNPPPRRNPTRRRQPAALAAYWSAKQKRRWHSGRRSTKSRQRARGLKSNLAPRRNPTKRAVTSRNFLPAGGQRVVGTVAKTARGRHKVTAVHFATRQGVRNLNRRSWTQSKGWQYPPGYRRAPRRNPGGRRKGKNGQWAVVKNKRGRRARRSTSMAKGSRKRSRAMKAHWRRRKAAGKQGGLGRTKRRRRKAATAKPRRRRRKAAAASPKRRRRTRRRKAAGGAKRRRRRTRARKATRRRRRRSPLRRTVTAVAGSRTRRTRMRPKMRRSRRRTVRMIAGPGATTVRINPARRRRRKHRRRSHRRRRSSRRRYRSYRRNPGGFLVDLAKRAVPVALSYVASRMFVGKIGPMIPGVSALGTLQGPVLSLGAVGIAHFATKKVGALARHRESIMTGTVLSALGSLFVAFAPASIQQMLGMGDYVAIGDYIAVGGAPPLRENFTLSDYVAVGGDGVEEELGLEEELGVEEELGDARLGGMPGGANILKQVPSQAFVQAIPARSFTKQIPGVTGQYDNAAAVYTGIFDGRFGG